MEGSEGPGAVGVTTALTHYHYDGGEGGAAIASIPTLRSREKI